LRPGDRATIRRVRDSDPELLCYLEERGLIPQIHITVLEYSPFDDNLTIQVEGQTDTLVLGSRVTDQVFVDGIE
jgi:DtxR family Mn-dependent transcriptional regulator